MLALYHNDMSLCAQKVRVCLAEKGLQWESRHLVLRAGEHQQPWYVRLNRRAVVPTLLDGDQVIPESNVILEYLDETYPDPLLAPSDPHGRAKMRLWTKQLDEDVHDASAAVLSFGIAFRHQYLERGELGKKMLEKVPNIFSCKQRPSFHEAIVKWENADYLGLMQRRGAEAWPQVQQIMRSM